MNFFENIIKFLENIINAFTNFYQTILIVFDLIPEPFKSFLTGGLFLFLVLIALKIKEKFL